MEVNKIILNEITGSSLTCILQPVGDKYVFEKRGAIIVIPGGAYAYCSDREAEPVALSFSAAGYQTFILRYTCRDKAQWPTPLDEYEQVMEIIHSNADNWHIDTNRIATIGFSAGGHLAACTATIARNKPSASILVYPVTLRDIGDCCMANLPVPVDCVDKYTVPCFLVACRDDPTVHITNTLAFELALAENGIPFESHIYSYGGHGFSIVDTVNEESSTSLRTVNWVKDCIGWLEENFGKLSKNGFSSPNPKVLKNGDTREFYSVDCTTFYMTQQPEYVQVLLQEMYDRFKNAGFGLDVSEETLYNAFGFNTVRQNMEMLGFTLEEICILDEKLSKIANITM